MPVDRSSSLHTVKEVNITMHDQLKDLTGKAERLANIFIVLQRSFVLNLSDELMRGNVTFPQFLLLSFLSFDKKPMMMTEVAKRMHHTTAAATGLVDRLEKLALVSRQADTKDRRKVFANITAKGDALVHQIRRDMVTNLTRLMEHLDESEQVAWLRIYEKIFPHCQQ